VSNVEHLKKWASPEVTGDRLRPAVNPFDGTNQICSNSLIGRALFMQISSVRNDFSDFSILVSCLLAFYDVLPEENSSLILYGTLNARDVYGVKMRLLRQRLK
jgi:hypothetical protein